ncbi:MAG: 4Fe-4S binding protein [Pseudomonadota bacterium]
MTTSFLICPSTGLTEDDAHALSSDERSVTIAPAILNGDDAGSVDAIGTGSILCSSEDSQVFEALADAVGAPAPLVIDLPRKAGWDGSGAAPLAKLTALLQEATLPARPAKTIDVTSDGICLILGGSESAFEAAEQLKNYLSVTLLIPPGPDASSASVLHTQGFDTVIGTLRKARGAFGQFDVEIDAFQRFAPTTNGQREVTEPRNSARSSCDILLDLRGTNPLFPAHQKREGYLRADPAHAPSVAAAVLAASHLTGTFEKPLYVQAEPMLCAHSRAGQTGCTRCLDICPTGAITSAGDHVSIDPMICAGCGACSSTCPSGAISYDAPPVEQTMRQVQTLAQAAIAAASADATPPHLLVHDAYGAEMIRLAVLHGSGLPADVIPLNIGAIGAFGHAEMLAALAGGFASVSILPGPGADLPALEDQLAIGQALSGGLTIQLLHTSDPEDMVQMLSQPAATSDRTPVRPMGTRRQISRQAARALNPDTTTLALPTGAPYGAVAVNTDACTLCLSCVSLCPSGALGDNPDKPQLRFQEDACLQCGLCVQLCPEDALTLAPQMNVSDSALEQVVLNEEEPFPCVSCGTLFGSKSTIDRITEKLTGHAMFNDPEKLRMIQMCDDCRVAAQLHSESNPFTAGQRPRPRTTDDYLSDRRDH